MREPEITPEFRGERVAEIRVAAGLSQSALAQALGRSQSWVSNIEQNYRPLNADDASLIAACFGVAVEDLYAPLGDPIRWIGHGAPSDEPAPFAADEITPLVQLLERLARRERDDLIEQFVRQARVRVQDSQLTRRRRR